MQGAEQLIKETQQYAKTILNSLSAHIAIIDEHGIILETNRAWREFAQSNQICIRPDTLNANYLEEANAALRAVLRQRDEDQKELEQTMLQNLREAVFPCVERLRQSEQREEPRRWIERIASGLDDIASPFLRRLSALEQVLTPQEIKVATLIREGRTTKEIAQEWNLSVATVNFHRRNLRNKLGLRGSSTNLRTYLLALSP